MNTFKPFQPQRRVKPEIVNLTLAVKKQLYDQLSAAAIAYGVSRKAFALQAIDFALNNMEPLPKDQMKARGGHARAAKLTPEQRSEIARKGAVKRWSQAPWAEQDGIPVVMQLPNKPETELQVGYAPANAPAYEIAQRYGVSDDNLVEGKIVRRKGQQRWRLCVLNLPQGF